MKTRNSKLKSKSKHKSRRKAGSGKITKATGVIIGSSKGHGQVRVDSNSLKLPLSRHQMRQVLHGDRVEVSLKHSNLEIVVHQIEKITEANNQFLGIYRTLHNGDGEVTPLDNRLSRRFKVRLDESENASDGDRVLVSITRNQANHKQDAARVLEVLAHDMPDLLSELVIREHNLPYRWSSEVEAEIRSLEARLQSDIVNSEASNRTDLTHLNFVTIDGEDARDFDDAVYVEEQGTQFLLRVAIADVAHFVKAHSAIDEAALNRGNSVYFPHRVIPMLPELLTFEHCSLRPNEKKLVLVCDMQISKEGELLNSTFCEATISSSARLTYEEVTQWLELRGKSNGTINQPGKSIQKRLNALDSLYRVLAKSRLRRGCIDLDLPEVQCKLTASGEIQDIQTKPRLLAHQIIEECMLLANISAAKKIKANPGYAPYRIHPRPSDEKMAELRTLLNHFAHHLPGDGTPSIKDLQRLVRSIQKDQENSFLLQTMLLRCLAKARYSSEEIGHFALHYPHYSHFTSPIRRYADLMTHRLIKGLIHRQNKQELSTHGRQLDEIAEKISNAEERANKASYDLIRRLQIRFIDSKIGQVFEGTVTGLQSFGAFVRLDQWGIEGLLHCNNMLRGYYYHDPEEYRLYNPVKNHQLTLGERVHVRLSAVDINNGFVDFCLHNGE